MRPEHKNVKTWNRINLEHSQNRMARVHVYHLSNFSQMCVKELTVSSRIYWHPIIMLKSKWVLNS